MDKAMEFVLKWLVVKPSKCQKAIKATKATKATKLGFCSCGQGVFFRQYVLRLLVVKTNKSQKVKKAMKAIKAIKAILAFMRLQSGVPFLLSLYAALGEIIAS